ncbi:DivIVA domain-containing protein [Bifidobacterium simiarum]|uniref:DivIVA domain-containing protein n=1 Tax=Bifidobacterium simiarum TaxID=2045441 RepID=UPI001BDDB4DF|nr:DivIVA domain-containing protein [Bifidobacterium simiarum]MBT1165355.1 DivIVA domain-containing protein [Bifidobacterium simiarum]
MAQQPVSERAGASLARAGKRKWGYDVAQVDSFLERAHHLYEDDEPKMTQEDIQNVSFALEKDGYVISQVDAALNRLEKAVVDKQTQWDVNAFGRVAWRAATERLAHSLYPRAERPVKERFADGQDKKPSYDRKQVDRLVDQLVGKIRRDLGESDGQLSDAQRKADAELSSTQVANIIFTQRTGKKGYAERQVDAYLNRAVQVLSRLESFARLEGPLTQVAAHADDDDVDAESASATSAAGMAVGSSEESVAEQTMTPPAAPSRSAVNPSVASDDDQAAGSGPDPVTVPPAARRRTVSSRHDKSFYDLRKAESEIFSGSSASAVAGPAAAVSGSLAGLVNAASPQEKASADDVHDVQSQSRSSDPSSASAHAQSQPTMIIETTPKESHAVPAPHPQPTATAQSVAPSQTVVSAQTAVPEQSAAAKPEISTSIPRFAPAPRSPRTDSGTHLPRHARTASESGGVNDVAIDSWAVDFAESAPRHGSHDAASSNRVSSNRASSGYASSESPAHEEARHAGGANGTANPTSHTAETPSSPSAPSSHAGSTNGASVFEAKDEADDYFAALLDTSSMPAVDFHIPNLTFPSADDDFSAGLGERGRHGKHDKDDTQA